jgi:hypothetical protein
MSPNCGAERCARRRLSLALYLSRFRSSEVLDGTLPQVLPLVVGYLVFVYTACASKDPRTRVGLEKYGRPVLQVPPR